MMDRLGEPVAIRRIEVNDSFNYMDVNQAKVNSLLLYESMNKYLLIRHHRYIHRLVFFNLIYNVGNLSLSIRFYRLKFSNKRFIV